MSTLAHNHPHYNLSFTAASLRPELARILADCFLDVGSWYQAKERILGSNALQCRTPSSAIRLERELRQRLQLLTSVQLELLATGNADDRAAMAWLAVLKSIAFVFEFVSEVLRDKMLFHDPTLRLSDYDAFEVGKAQVHSALESLKPSSKRKIRQVLMLMLTEVGMLVKGEGLGRIHRPALSRASLEAIALDDRRWLAGFLLTDAEIGGIESNGAQ
jgi:hypothetical protein